MLTHEEVGDRRKKPHMISDDFDKTETRITCII